MTATARSSNWSYVASIGVLTGGILVVLGSTQTWGICPDSSCGFGGLQSLLSKSGINSGAGAITAILGIALVLIGATSLIRTVPRRSVAWLAIATLVVTVVYVVRVHVLPENAIAGPLEGVYVVIAGAVLAMATSLWPRRSVVA
jgi:hypothetical protein